MQESTQDITDQLAGRLDDAGVKYERNVSFNSGHMAGVSKIAGQLRGSGDKPERKKPVNYVMIPAWEISDPDVRADMIKDGEVPEKSEPYRMMDTLIANYHDHLAEAKIGLCWQRGLKEDKDGKLELGRCRKASDLSREFADFDFIITLNEMVWDAFKAAERAALLDHELCHAQVSKNEDGDVKRDERGRIVYRIRKHDLEEFRDIVDRHGCWKDDLTRFAEALMASKQGSLLPRRRRAE